MTRRRRSTILFFLLLLIGSVVFAGLRLRARQHQYALDRQLIAVLVNDDRQQALLLVNEGADPNTPLVPPRAPSVRQLWNRLLHRSPMPPTDGNTAFMIACGGAFERGKEVEDVTAFEIPEHPELLKTMLANGAHLDAYDDNHNLPLVCVAAHSEAVRLLLEHGANANACGPVFTALEAACASRSSTSVRLLLEHGANINARNDGDVEILRNLVSTAGEYPDRESTEVLSLLLAHGANPNAPRAYGKTVLEYARENQRADLVAFLRRYGAKK